MKKTDEGANKWTGKEGVSKNKETETLLHQKEQKGSKNDKETDISTGKQIKVSKRVKKISKKGQNHSKKTRGTNRKEQMKDIGLVVIDIEVVVVVVVVLVTVVVVVEVVVVVVRM